MKKSLVAAFSFCFLGGLACSPSAAGPVVYFEHENVENFGDLTQKDVKVCPDTACGPVAAVNSFVFLQREYASIYGSKLVPAVDGTKPTPAELVAAATDLAKNYMGSCCVKGTHITQFINGKKSYFDKVAPDTTVIHGQVRAWDVSVGGDKPDFIDEHEPTPQFLLSELNHNEDIELLFDFGGDSGHYVTLTSLFWNDADGNGNIDNGEAANIGFIDPADGKPGSGRLSQLAGGRMAVEYTNPKGDLVSGSIFGAVAESPARRSLPEPASGLLVMAALALALSARHVAKRRICAS